MAHNSFPDFYSVFSGKSGTEAEKPTVQCLTESRCGQPRTCGSEAGRNLAYPLDLF